MSSRSAKERIQDILNAIDSIQRRTAGMNVAITFMNLFIFSQSFSKPIINEVFGTASPMENRVLAQYSKTNWGFTKDIAGMRDVITHDYDEVDLDEVWTVINENLPQRLADIEPLTLPES